RILKKGADRGDPEAQYMLAMCYRDGDGAMRDQRKAAYWFVQAADHGHAESAYAAGLCYRSGIDGALSSSDKETAIYYQRNGTVTTKLETASFDYFSLAAEQGHMESQYEIGLCYKNGIGVASDIDLSKVWLQRASDKGHLSAMLYLVQNGLVQDPAIIFRYAELAASEGSADGQFELASCYRKGTGIEVDMFSAKLWFQRASDQVCIIDYYTI
ncbi:unnamed protein product, partial [Ectocarpus fasciculatus]